jgi:hypothetical protein
VPSYFIPEGAEISNAQTERGGYITAVNVKLSVGEALEFYEKAVKENGYDLINLDNEGFEAEVFFRSKESLASIQIRTSTCDDRSIVFINEIDPGEMQQ